jgi:hypothetical protein
MKYKNINFIKIIFFIIEQHLATGCRGDTDKPNLRDIACWQR